MANAFDQFDAPPANPFDAFDSGVSPYSPEGIAATNQKLVETIARRKQLREEADADALRPKVFVGVNAPFSDRRLATFEVPAELAAFGSEAVKSSPSVAAGAAAASAATPAANRVAALAAPIPYAPAIARFGIPLVAGGIAAMGERLAQEQALPQILPEDKARLYRDTGELAAESPIASQLGQIAGAGPFFRPGLPVGTTGGARLAVPLITGGIGAGIEGAQQIGEGEFDPQKLAIAAVGGALMNRETPLGARIAPNLVLPQIQGRGVPDELAAIGRIMAEPRLPQPTLEVPAELAAVQQAREGGAAERAGEAMAGADTGEIRLRRLAERMAGKSPDQQLEVLNQEVQLAGDSLTPPQERAALEMKQALENQVEAGKQAEQQAKEAERVAKEQQKAQAEAVKAAQEALQPPEVPKSTQILAEGQKPPALANVATEIGTQTSPFAVQEKINQLTAVPPAEQQIAGPAPQGITAAAPTPEVLKADLIKNAVADKATEYIYSVQRGPNGKGGFTQVDAIQNGENTVSSNPADLRKAGANIPEVPDWVPQGRYSVEEINALIKQGEPEFITGKPVSIKGWHATDKAVPADELHPESWFSNSKDAVDFYYSGPEHGTKIHAEVEMKNPLVVSYDEFVNQRQGPVWWQTKAAREGHDGVIIQDIQDGDRVSTVFAPIVTQNSEPQIREISREGVKQGEPKNAIQEQSPSPLSLRNAPEAGAGIRQPNALDQGAAPARQEAPQGNGGAPAEAVAEAVMPRTAEQRLNDAGADLPPISGMSRAAKRAELDAAGVTTYKGKPLDEANPAEISAAVGKLRRGESLDLTPPDIIETLQSKKRLPKRPKGEIASAGPDLLFDAAHDAALDVAILGIRAGRALAEVIQMAVAKYRSLHPRATDEQVRQLTKDITEAHGVTYDQPRTEAEQLMASAPPFEAAAGRPVEASQAAANIRSQRGAIFPSVLAPVGGAVVGGGIGFGTTERREGESERDFQFRRLRNAALGAGIGGALGAGAVPRGVGAPKAAIKPLRKEGVSVPTPEEGQGVRQLAEKVIEDRSRSSELRKTLAENPEIIYDKFLLGDLTERAAAATPEELASMRVSGDVNQQAMATIELANRAAAEGRDAEAADLYAQSSKFFTSPAQLLGVAKAVRSPQGFTEAVKTELKQEGRTTTPAQEKKITELGRRMIQTEQALARAERAAKEDFSPENQTAYENAKKAAAEAGNALLDYTSQIVPKGLDDTIIQVIQGNLLTPLSQIANVYGNILFQPVRRGAMSIASGLDAIYSGVTRRPRTIDRTNPLPRAAELQAFAEGTKIAAKELLTGPSADSYVKGEVQRGFRPLRALAQALTGKNLPVQADGTVALSDRAKKLIEGTIGAPPEIMFRLLNLGDRGFRRAAEAETLLEQGRLRGLKGRELEKFIEFPDKATQALLNTEARKAIFAQENAGVNQLNHFLDSGIAKLLHLDQIPVAKGAIKVFGRLNVPFRQFPLNYVMTALNFAAPELAAAKAIYYFGKGQRRQALTNIGEGIMGATMYGAAAYLWKHGLISEPTDKEAKNRSVQYDNMGGQRINVSGLERALAGGDPTWRRDDTTIDWGRMGIPAPVFYVYTADQAKGNKALQQTGVRPPEDKSVTGQLINRVSSYPGIGQFALDQSFLAGSSAFLEALKNGFQGPEADAWAANMFRAGSTLAVPNTVEALARANYQYIPDLTGDTLTDTVKNIWAFKTFQLPKDDRALLKRDIWGEPVNRTPPGVNPYVYQFLDVTKGQTRPTDPFKAALVRTFNESNNLGAYPAIPSRSMSVQGVTAKLEPRDYETLQALTGRLRRQEAEPMVLDPEFNSIPAGERVAELEKIYSRAAADAKDQMLADEGFRMKYFPEVFGGIPGERVTRRNTAARNRLEERVPEPAPTQAANPFDAFEPAAAK